MNAVLQALAHAPELCTAMDCAPHRSVCPIAAENAAKMSRSASPSASSNEGSTASDPPFHSGPDSNGEQAPTRKTATRKSLRSSGRKSPPEDIRKKSDWTFCALCELEEHIQKVHDETGSASTAQPRDQPVAPSAFVHGFIDHVAPCFELGVQEDSHEFLRLLIDAMQQSCQQARPSLKDDVNDDSPTASRTRSARNSKKNQVSQDSKDTEYPFALFRGTVESTVTCESCKATSSTLDPIEDIGLEVIVPNQASSTSRGVLETVRSSSRNTSPTPAAFAPLADVTTAFTRFARPEPLDAGYKCERCGKVGRANKQSRLASIPPILTLHLKRFRYGDAPAAPTSRRSGREVGQLMSSQASNDVVYGGGSGSAKIEGHIKFHHLFDLRPYLTEELQEKHSNMFCRLFAVVVHAGKNSHSGHYIAYVRSLAKKEEWWKMDDGRVTPVTIQQVKQAEAYMLFYRVVQHPVATQLEQEFKKLKTEEEEYARTNVHDLNLSKSNSSFPSNLPRKRRADCAFPNGEEWVRAKTHLPPPYIDVVRKSEDKIADDLVLSTQLITKLSEQAAKNDSSPSKQKSHPISGKFAVALIPKCAGCRT
jgi:ubiquitin C-terminal hydrolase